MKHPVYGRWSWLRTRLPFEWTRAQLVWCAFLWLADQYRLERRRQATAAFERIYAELGQKLWHLTTRPSPFLTRIAESEA